MTPILKPPSNQLKLQSTKPEKGQEWCAITYLLVPEPKTSTYGTLKVLCFGSTCEEVETILGDMMKDGRVEKSLPFMQIIKTGDWRKLVAGGEKSDTTASMNTEDGTIVAEVQKEKAKRNADAAKELDARMKEVQAEAEGKTVESPYDEYARYRTQRVMAIQRKKQLEEDLKLVNQALGNAITRVKVIESEHGNFRLKFNAENKTQDSTGEMARLETELPTGYVPSKPWTKLNPREHDDTSN